VLFVLLIQELSSCNEIACRLGGWFSWSSSLPILHLVSVSSSCARTREAWPHSRHCFETGRGRGCEQGAFPGIASLWLQLCLVCGCNCACACLRAYGGTHRRLPGVHHRHNLGLCQTPFWIYLGAVSLDTDGILSLVFPRGRRQVEEVFVCVPPPKLPANLTAFSFSRFCRTKNHKLQVAI
jgi:hypothetical protein